MASQEIKRRIGNNSGITLWVNETIFGTGKIVIVYMESLINAVLSYERIRRNNGNAAISVSREFFRNCSEPLFESMQTIIAYAMFPWFKPGENRGMRRERKWNGRIRVGE
jgi:hypothetical protein